MQKHVQREKTLRIYIYFTYDIVDCPLQSQAENRMTYFAGLSLREHCTDAATHCASNHCSGAPQRPGARDHCLGVLRGQFNSRNDCSSRVLFLRRQLITSYCRCLFAHCPRIHCGRTARQPVVARTLGRASQPLSARNRCSSRLLRIRQHSKTPPRVIFSHIALDISARACSAASGRSKAQLQRASKPFSARNRCDRTFVFSSKSLSKSLCFGFCIASSCALRDFTSTIRCHMLLGTV